jgi:hypothetical protein
MNAMLLTFRQAVEALQQAHVPFICLKGFSLIPEYLADLWQRHQIDFDLLVAPRDALNAQGVLEKLGYKLTAVDGEERRLRIPVLHSLPHNAYLYRIQEGAAIELHSYFWETGTKALSLRWPIDVFEQAEMHTVGSVSFLRMARQHAFLYQVLHVFRHFMGSWTRLLWLYEIAVYMHKNRDDAVLWQKVQAIVSVDAQLAEAVALVLLCAQDLFACPVPSALGKICSLPINSPVYLWVERYAHQWLLADMPGNKLNLLLQRHYCSDNRAWRHYIADRLAPRGKRPMLCEGLDADVAKTLAYRADNLRFLVSRIWHHLKTGVGFALASIPWEINMRRSQDAITANNLRRGEL